MKRKKTKKNKQKEREKEKERKKERKKHSSTLKGVEFSYIIKREILSLEVNTAKLGAF